MSGFLPRDRVSVGLIKPHDFVLLIFHFSSGNNTEGRGRSELRSRDFRQEIVLKPLCLRVGHFKPHDFCIINSLLLRKHSTAHRISARSSQMRKNDTLKTTQFVKQSIWQKFRTVSKKMSLETKC